VLKRHICRKNGCAVRQLRQNEASHNCRDTQKSNVLFLSSLSGSFSAGRLLCIGNYDLRLAVFLCLFRVFVNNLIITTTVIVFLSSFVTSRHFFLIFRSTRQIVRNQHYEYL
jgi:hypothetical protein